MSSVNLAFPSIMYAKKCINLLEFCCLICYPIYQENFIRFQRSQKRLAVALFTYDPVKVILISMRGGGVVWLHIVNSLNLLWCL
jgi:hypothetical protein